jgi:hypothetical protein
MISNKFKVSKIYDLRLALIIRKSIHLEIVIVM